MTTSCVVLAFLGWPEIVAILVIVLILFGAKKLPELAKGLGQGIKEFKKASREVQDEMTRAVEEDHTHSAPRQTTAATPPDAAGGTSTPKS